MLYESPYRVQKTVEDIVKIIGNRYIVIARELTKKFEEFIRGYAADILTELSQRKLKGEIVILIAGTDFIINHNPKNRTMINGKEKFYNFTSIYPKRISQNSLILRLKGLSAFRFIPTTSPFWVCSFPLISAFFYANITISDWVGCSFF